MRLRTKTPDAVRAVDIGTERRLAWGLTDAGAAVVATEAALHLPGLALPWWQVEKATWDPPRLLVREVPGTTGLAASGLLHQVQVDEQHRLAEIVRTQVTASVAWSDRRALSPRGAVRLVGRRQPGRDALLWQQVYEAGTDVTDPLVRAQADALVEELRRTLG